MNIFCDFTIQINARRFLKGIAHSKLILTAVSMEALVTFSHPRIHYPGVSQKKNASTQCQCTETYHGQVHEKKKKNITKSKIICCTCKSYVQVAPAWEATAKHMQTHFTVSRQTGLCVFWTSSKQCGDTSCSFNVLLWSARPQTSSIGWNS